ncbi:MAG: hypothetical protein AB7G23_16885 [Vicinamibacterales bacterium]
MMQSDGDAGGGMATDYGIRRDQYVIDPGFLADGLVRLGDGVDMSVPAAPGRRIGQSPLLPPSLLGAEAVESFTLSESFTFAEVTSVSQESKVLSAYFKGRYGLVSADAAYQQAKEDQASSQSLYALAEGRGHARDITEVLGGRPLAWNPELRPVLEGTAASDADFARQFLLDFGSHYVASIEYGYRVAIRGKLSRTATKETANVRAAFRAAFISGSAEGGVSAEHRKALESSSLELAFEATSGGLYEGETRRLGILTNLDDILTTLKALRTGTLVIRAAPLAAVARTYWNLLPATFERSRALLATGSVPLPEAAYGVPAGTIVAWAPTPRHVQVADDGSRTFVLPEGWALCDGRDGRPDLRDRFVMGTAALEAVGQAGGAATHAHAGTVAKTKSTRDQKGGVAGVSNYALGTHTHDVTIAPGSSLPPHVTLVFLVRS